LEGHLISPLQVASLVDFLGVREPRVGERPRRHRLLVELSDDASNDTLAAAARAAHLTSSSRAATEHPPDGSSSAGAGAAVAAPGHAIMWRPKRKIEWLHIPKTGLPSSRFLRSCALGNNWEAEAGCKPVCSVHARAASPAAAGLSSRRLAPHPTRHLAAGPHAGTSFGNVLLLWACPKLPPRIWVTSKGVGIGVTRACRSRFRPDLGARRSWFMGEHTSLTSRTDGELRNVFTLVRSPKTRLASGYHWRYRYRASHVTASEREICAAVRGSRIMHVASGVQVRMLVGEPIVIQHGGHCFASGAPPTAAMAEEACRRLQLLAYVGVSDFWGASVCLFHAMHGGKVHEDLEHKNVRKGGYSAAAEATKAADCGDQADERLFECAMELFLRRLDEHPHCVQHMHAKAFGNAHVDALFGGWLAGHNMSRTGGG
jgi:hypothetical protein